MNDLCATIVGNWEAPSAKARFIQRGTGFDPCRKEIAENRLDRATSWEVKLIVEVFGWIVALIILGLLLQFFEAVGVFNEILIIPGVLGVFAYIYWHHGRVAEVNRRVAEVKRRKAYLNELVLQTQKELPGLSDHVLAAEQHLDLAKKEFEERVFALFWDEIEYATKNLAMYQHGVRLIGSRAAEYQREADMMPGSSPPFALPTSRLPDARGTADRLVQIVRKAQKDFQFATIYEQRKTNTILVEGFSTFGTAIYAVSDAITSSIADLSASLRVSGDQLMSQIAVDADARRRFEEDALEKLDNIQRGRKPWP